MKSIMIILPVSLALSGCLSEDYAELCQKRIAKDYGSSSVEVTDSKWVKTGQNISVSISFKAKNAEGAVVNYLGSCSIKGDSVVKFNTKSIKT